MSKQWILKNEAGKRYGNLQVISFNSTRRGSAMWNCICDCGKESVVMGADLRRGATTSCGCYGLERTRAANRKHGHSAKNESTRTYDTWRGIKKRCSNPKAVGYENYGGRGIKVCERWWNSFENFLKDMGEKPIGMSIGRINNNGNYCPENCRWETREQQANNSRNCRYINFGGKIQNSLAWAKELGIKPSVLSWRLNNGWTIEEALTTPYHPKIAQAVMIQNETKNDSKKHRPAMLQEAASKINPAHSGASGNENWPSDDSPEVPS